MTNRRRRSVDHSPGAATPGHVAARRLGVDPARLRAFCRRWKVAELALFGSALRDDFVPDSDLDLLVRWTPEATWGLLDHVRMEEELGQLFGRRVDLVSRQAVEASPNWIIRRSILDAAEPLYVA